MIKSAANEQDEIAIEDLYDVCVAHKKKIKVDSVQKSARTVLGYLSTFRPPPKIVDKLATQPTKK